MPRSTDRVLLMDTLTLIIWSDGPEWLFLNAALIDTAETTMPLREVCSNQYRFRKHRMEGKPDMEKAQKLLSSKGWDMPLAIEIMGVKANA